MYVDIYTDKEKPLSSGLFNIDMETEIKTTRVTFKNLTQHTPAFVDNWVTSTRAGRTEKKFGTHHKLPINRVQGNREKVLLLKQMMLVSR